MKTVPRLIALSIVAALAAAFFCGGCATPGQPTEAEIAWGKAQLLAKATQNQIIVEDKTGRAKKNWTEADYKRWQDMNFVSMMEIIKEMHDERARAAEQALLRSSIYSAGEAASRPRYEWQSTPYTAPAVTPWPIR